MLFELAGFRKGPRSTGRGAGVASGLRSTLTIRLVALDLAVTTPHRIRLSERDREALRAVSMRGVHVALVSAQGSAEVRTIGDALGLRGPTVAERGAHVVAADGDELARVRIPTDVARRVLAEATLPLFVFMKVGAVVYARPTPKRWWERGVKPPPGVEMVGQLEDRLDDGPWWIIANGHVRDLVRKLAGAEIDVTVALPDTVAEFALFTPRGGSREDALRRLRYTSASRDPRPWRSWPPMRRSRCSERRAHGSHGRRRTSMSGWLRAGRRPKTARMTSPRCSSSTYWIIGADLHHAVTLRSRVTTGRPDAVALT